MKKLIPIAVLLIFVVSTIVTTTARPDFKPSPAKDVELVKKVTLKGPKAKGGKPKKQAATGFLGEPCTGEKYAIIIGISDYPGEENDLNYADDDAKDVNKTLVEVYGFNPNNIYLLIDGDATWNNIIAAIENVKSKAQSGDEVVFFFSGHGARGIADDGDKERIDEAIVVYDSYIWDGDLKLWFSSFNTSRIIFAFDSCLAGGMTDLKADGRIIAMATTENGLSYEGSSWENGQFTYYFFDQGMYYGFADVYDHDGDGSLTQPTDTTVEEAFDYAKANCEWQRPTISDLFTNDLLL
ncbi:caspase family protein [Archaeoglobales archaeon]|nr:MAG: caspase family protein [Archaeoglobales archaeon]